ncbi:uncharacterized protein LOC142628952 [Castanea sativa]|uniref:uncharacterized protein LOC142628952 n=1 Tax=Castanea sativa TaxID=21020 RepID=UPI003F64BC00
MSVITWKCRGLRNPCTVNTLHKMVMEEDPTLVFLIETKFEVLEMARIKRKLERHQGLVVPSVKRAGGLALLWKSSMKVEVQTYSPRHIDAIVTEDQCSMQWRFTGFYGHPETSMRGESWTSLEQLSGQMDLLWVIMGDFNEILHESEKVGGNKRPASQMKHFGDVINRTNLRDLGYVGSDFTWCRHWGTPGWIRERLDRTFISTNWAACFPHARLHYVTVSTSDHCMLVLKDGQHSKQARCRPKLFKFESMWLRNSQCKDLVQDAWFRGSCKDTPYPFNTCMEECRESLTHWNKITFGHVGKKINALRQKL